jgi:hypothetical protein
MLNYNVTRERNSIEEVFAKKFEDSQKVPMSNEISDIFIRLTLLKETSLNISELEKPFFYKVMEKRISTLHNYKIDDKVLLFLSCICESLGDCIMYIWYIQYQCKKRNINTVTFDVFSDMFSWGFPSKETLSKLWDSQKIERFNSLSLGSDNLLDYHSAGQSLF